MATTKLKITRKDKFLNQETFFTLFDDFINDSYSGGRTKKNGTRISKGTIDNYTYLKKNLLEFVDQSSFDLKIYIVTNLTQTEKERANRYYKKFYKAYSNFMYDKKKYYDNYVGLMIKSLRTFLNYLENERNVSIGRYHGNFYIPKEEIPIIALNTEQLNYIIFDEEFTKRAQSNNLMNARDIFVFGCTVGLRISDLLKLTKKNLLVQGDKYYIRVKSQKTGTYTSIKLPDYAIDIIERHDVKKGTLLPSMSIAWTNKQFKELGKLIPNNFEMVKTRERRGKQVVVYKDPKRRIHYTLADHITSHTMRRTAITTLLNLGMPEHMVRKISGHAANSREFFRYVKLSQSMLDNETDKVFDQIQKQHNNGTSMLVPINE